MASSDGDTANFFRVSNYNEAYWTTYLAARPKYSSSFYNRIYTYHAAHSSSNALAHDIGTGPGQVAAALASHFIHIIASDNNSTHLAVAAHRLATLHDVGKVVFAKSSAEALATSYPPGSADLIAAAECLPLFDPPAAIASFAHLLAAGGTLAIWFYGRPAFAEPGTAAKCQPLLDEILDRSFARIIKGGGPAHKAGWKRATDCMASWLDNVALPEGEWRDVERWKWNPALQMSFYGPEACDFEIERTSAVEKGEKVHEEEDPGFWAERWDIEGVRRFVSVNLPKFEETVKGEEDEIIERKYKDLEEAMGGPGAERQITWPVVLILGTKK